MTKLNPTEQGLTTQEAESLREKFGWNSLPEKHKNGLLVFLSYFWGPIPWMIETAAILSAVLSHWQELCIITAMLLINAVVGFWQEHKADTAIELMKAKLSLTARVLRDGVWIDAPSKDLVPGDLVLVRLGNIIPADLKLTSGDFLSIDQSALTGESLPVDKQIGEDAYSGSIVKQGEMKGIVTKTGINTFFGKTAKLVESAGTTSHFQKAVLSIGNFLIFITIALIILILGVALYRHDPFLETLQFCLILTVAAIPVALPAVLSVTMAVGAVKLSRMKAIVSKLVALEELAGIDILCSDKTGTLTQNKLTVGDPWVVDGVDAKTLFLEAGLASNSDDKDAIDEAILTAADQHDLKTYQQLHFTPFDPVKKYTAADISKDNLNFSVAKGAPQVILALCTDQNFVDHINSKVTEFAGQGYRTLGVARQEKDKSWVFRGLIPLFDPPQDDAATTIDEAKSMGVHIKMMTGDHVAIAKQIATKIHLGSNIVTAGALLDDPNHDLIERVDGIAEVFPEHKYAVVQALQSSNHIVGMTGDGVNDAPALKQADAGIAVCGATDAARAAADIVLTEPGISVIISAIQEARRIFHRMTSYATFRIAETVRVLLFMTLSILLFNFYPVTAIMIVLLAMLNDFPIMMIAFDNAPITPKPARWDMHRVLKIATVLGITGVIESFLLFWYVKTVLHLPESEIQTLIFLKLLVAGHMTLFITRSEGWFWKKPWPRLSLVMVVETTQILGTLAAVYGVFMAPIGWIAALYVWGYAFACFVLDDMIKIRLVQRLNRQEFQSLEHPE